MLVVISDLHLTDGTTGQTISAAAFRDFRERLRDMVYDASWRKDGRYRPLSDVHVLLLGDIFDLLRSTQWNEEDPGDEGYVRPWDDPQSPAFTHKVQEITDAILSHNAEAMAFLAGLTRENYITLPPPTRAGRPAMEAKERTPAPVHLHYMIGNHDWMYHLPGAAYDQMRRQVETAMGLTNGATPFPHEPDELPPLAALLEQHEVFARHGDIYDRFNYDAEKGRDAATLGDAIVVDLVNRFPHVVEREMGDDLPQAFLDGLGELANVRPSLIIPAWIDGLLKNLGLGKTAADEVKRIWDELAEEFLDIPFVRRQDKPFWPDLVDLLQVTLQFSRGVSFAKAGSFVRLIRETLWGGYTSFSRHALEEKAFKRRLARHIVYGHTHHYEVVPLDTIYTPSGLFDQICFNSGTWHPIHELTIRHPSAQRFVHYYVMTYLAFFRGDERRGQPFETWSGTLGTASLA